MMQSNRLLQREANEFRQKNGIGSSEPIRIKSWLQKLGVIAVFSPLSSKFSGMAFKNNSKKFMFINSNHTLGKQHFTVAHELYHLFIQPDFLSEISYAGNFDKKNKIEYTADCFAAYLLMPEEGILSIVPDNELAKNKISLETVVKIEQFFACSRTALLFRLAEMNLIDISKYESFKKNIILEAKKLGFDNQIYLPNNHNLIIGDYGVKAKHLFDKESISESHYLSLMSDIGIDITSFYVEDEQE